MVTVRVVFEAEASGGEVRQVVSPTLPFPLSIPSPFPFPLSFQTNQWEGRSDPVRGKFPGFPPTNTALVTVSSAYYMFYTLHVVEPLRYDSVLIKETNE